MQTYLDIAKQALKQHLCQDQAEDSEPESYVFNELNEFNAADAGGEQKLIARLQVGQTLLLDHHHRWQASDSSAASDAEFSRVWNAWWDLDEQLRTDFEFQGCVFGTVESCPAGFPCQGCADLPAPAVVAQLSLGGR